MKDKNETTVSESLFLSLTNRLYQKSILFILFLFVYLVTLGGGNLGMVTLIWVDPRLHTPMYFFLSHLSFVDMCSSSSIAPRMVYDIFTEEKIKHFFLGCTVQLWFAGLFVGTGCFLLANMAYEWYTAICKPLLYTLIVSKSVCTQFVIGPYLLAAINITTHETLTFCLPFCGPNTINISSVIFPQCLSYHVLTPPSTR